MARTVLAGSVQRVSVRGLNHEKMAFDELERALQEEPLVVGNQVFRTGRRVPVDRGEYLILENSRNSDVDRCVVVNVEKTQLLIGFNISNAIVNHDVEAARVVQEAQPLFRITLVQPPRPRPVPVFSFEEESLRNTPLFLFNQLYMERANNHPLEPARAECVCLATLNPHERTFEWYCQQCYAMQRRYEQLALFVVVAGLTPQNAPDVGRLSPFAPRLNLVYDNLGSQRRFFGYLARGHSAQYRLELATDDIDELYARLQELFQSDRGVEEDNELIVRPDGRGITFMGVDLRFHNPDQPEPRPPQPEAPPPRAYKRVKDNAVSAELYEVEGDPGDDDEPEPEPEPDPDADDPDDDAEEQRDPLNTYVVAFWNPRHRDFQARFYEFLQLADPEAIRQYVRQQGAAGEGASGAEDGVGEGANGVGADPADEALAGTGGAEPGASAAPQAREDARPYLRLYCCISGTRQINIGGYERKIPGMLQLAKVVLDNDWLYRKIQTIFNEKLTARTDQVNDGTDLGFFYVYNRQFKNIYEGEDFGQMAELVRQRGIVRRATRREEDE